MIRKARRETFETGMARKASCGRFATRCATSPSLHRWLIRLRIVTSQPAGSTVIAETTNESGTKRVAPDAVTDRERVEGSMKHGCILVSMLIITSAIGAAPGPATRPSDLPSARPLPENYGILLSRSMFARDGIAAALPRPRLRGRTAWRRRHARRSRACPARRGAQEWRLHGDH